MERGNSEAMFCDGSRGRQIACDKKRNIEYWGKVAGCDEDDDKLIMMMLKMMMTMTVLIIMLMMMIVVMMTAIMIRNKKKIRSLL